MPESVPTFLTVEEQELIDVLSDAAGRFAKLINPSRSSVAAADWAEVADKIHQLQAFAMMPAAQRAYPGRFRPMFEKVNLIGEPFPT
jgi:hypothetical protein